MQPLELAELDRLTATLEDRTLAEHDFPTWAETSLKIRTKSGAVVPFRMNREQRFIHAKLEEQKRKTGRVRAIVLKARQQGCSTYIQARFFRKVIHTTGLRAFILTHEQDATDNLFEMTRRYYDNLADDLRPTTGSASAKELIFSELDSGYKVGTAGTKGKGRSATIQLFHGSEGAYWPFAEEHATGIMQAIPDASGTEVIIESTGNGLGNWYHRMWQQAMAGENGYIAIFIPWFWQSEYRYDAGAASLHLDRDEAEYKTIHSLDTAQMAWRRAKIAEFGGGNSGLEKFRREYPATPEEAFIGTSDDVVIPYNLIRAAVARDVRRASSQRPIWGLDVARFGDDKSALAKRHANVILEPVIVWERKDLMQLCGLVKEQWLLTEPEDRPGEIMVDAIGVGAGVVDRLQEMGLPAFGVNVAELPSYDEARFLRLRDQLWWSAREFFEDRACSMPDDGATIADLASVNYRYTSADRVQIEPKSETKKRLGHSPDRGDAVILTFAGTGASVSSQRSYEPEPVESF